MRTVRLVGFDPSYTHWGMVSVDIDQVTGRMVRVVEMQVVKTAPLSTKKRTVKGKVEIRKTSDHMRRASELVSEARSFIARNDPLAIISEVSASPQSAAASFSFGVCLGILAGIDVPLVQVSQTEVKMASVGRKDAEKSDVTAWAVKRFPEADWKRGKRPNKLGVRASDGLFLIPDCEHMADGLSIVEAGLLTEAIKGMIGDQRRAT